MKNHLTTAKHFLGFAYAQLFKTGYTKSLLTRKPVDLNGNPIPMFAYPCIDYIIDLDLQSARMLEIGGGNSTLFFAERVASIVTLEPDAGTPESSQWLSYLKDRVNEKTSNKNIKIMPVTIPDLGSGCITYPEWTNVVDQKYKQIIDSIYDEDGPFDLVLVDEWAHQRDWLSCYVAKRISNGGLIIIDDTQNCQLAASHMRNLGFNQINFKGNQPGGARACTSIFFKGILKFYPTTGDFPGCPFYSPSDPIRTWQGC